MRTGNGHDRDSCRSLRSTNRQHHRGLIRRFEIGTRCLGAEFRGVFSCAVEAGRKSVPCSDGLSVALLTAECRVH